jgi:predicted DNA-binding transcriptional regulator AlpA
MPVPELVGIVAVADMLGITRQWADILSKRDDFPEPTHNLPTGRLWRSSEVEEWGAAHRKLTEAGDDV